MCKTRLTPSPQANRILVGRNLRYVNQATSTREHDGLSSKSVVNLLGINETRANESVVKCVMPQAISSSQTRERRQTCLRIPIRSSALSYSFWGMDDVRAMPLGYDTLPRSRSVVQKRQSSNNIRKVRRLNTFYN